MAEGGQNPLSSEHSDSTTSVQVSGSNHEPSFTNYRAQADQSNMEFASLPANHFGHMGMAQSPFDMRHMSNVLLDYPQRYHQSQHQSHVTQPSSVDPTFAYLPFSSQQFANHLANQYQSQYPQSLASRYQGMTGYATNTAVNVAELHAPNGLVYPHQHSSYSANMSQQPHYPNYTGQQPTPYGSGGVSTYQNRSGMAYQAPRLQPENTQMAAGSRSSAQYPEVLRRSSGSETSLQTSSALRGPPRKPKQSGHALWVGNLPPGTQITDLKDHFSREATEDIESVFLISKSNCAFVNYRSVETCAAAMTRFHDSRFRGVRLVCRLRRGSNTAASPASASIQPDSSKSTISADTMSDMRSPTSPLVVPFESSSATPRSSPGRIAKEKFFIVKSLTVEDLERSVISGIWATQAHNEENLNAAFESAEHVYLVFSANKSGEYFGYARMESQISADLTPASEPENPEMSTAAPLPSSAANVPITIPTSATSTAPRGHIVDDSARGTIFWEAEHDNVTTDGVSAESGETSGDDSAQKDVIPQATTFGKPFKISWQSTERLPFYRTRGLRNPWNANREVKIARDGTELEPSVGRKLLGMFEQQAQINAVARSGGPPPQYGGYAQQMPQYVGGGMMPQMGQMGQMPYGYGPGPQGSGPPYGRPY